MAKTAKIDKRVIRSYRVGEATYKAATRRAKKQKLKVSGILEDVIKAYSERCDIYYRDGHGVLQLINCKPDEQ